MTREDISRKIVSVLKSQGVLKAAIFGSYARGDARKSSDVDLLVELDDDKSLFDLVGLKLALEDALKRRVDVLTYDAIHPLLREIILGEQQIIMENFRIVRKIS